MTTGISQNKLRSQQEKPKVFHTRPCWCLICKYTFVRTLVKRGHLANQGAHSLEPDPQTSHSTSTWLEEVDSHG